MRSNGVRALGNLLRLVSKEDLCNGEVKECVISALKALVQNMSSGSNMKVGSQFYPISSNRPR